MKTLKDYINRGKTDFNIIDKELDSTPVIYSIMNDFKELNTSPGYKISCAKFLNFIENNIEVIGESKEDENTIIMDIYSFVEKNYDSLEKIFRNELNRSSFLAGDGLGIIDITDKMLSMIAGYGTPEFYKEFNDMIINGENLEEKQLQKINNKQDLESLITLSYQISDLKATNNNLNDFFTEIKTYINNKISDFFSEKKDISYAEYKHIEEKARKNLEYEKYWRILGEDRLGGIFESYNTKEIVETLNNLNIDKNFIIDSFVEEDQIREAVKYYNEINDVKEKIVYKDEISNIEVSKEDLNLIYGDKINNFSSEKLSNLGKLLVDKFFLEPEGEYENFIDFIINYNEEEEDLLNLEELDEEETE